MIFFFLQFTVITTKRKEGKEGRKEEMFYFTVIRAPPHSIHYYSIMSLTYHQGALIGIGEKTHKINMSSVEV